VKTLPWVEGLKYNDAQARYRARLAVMEEIELRSEKHLKKAWSILTGVVTELYNEKSFDAIEILPIRTQQKLRTTEQSIVSASKVIAGMTKSFNLGTARVLPSVSAVLAPSLATSSENDTIQSTSKRAFCDMLGINRKSKYVDAGFKNRSMYNEFLELEGEIKVGEKVSCCASPEGILMNVCNDGTVTISFCHLGRRRFILPPLLQGCRNTSLYWIHTREIPTLTQLLTMRRT